MTGNPISGHTNHNMTLSGTAQPVDGLTDGDHITSATLQISLKECMETV